MKIRNIFIILVLNYIILIVVSAVIEINSLANKAKEIQSIIRTSADMALEQTQLVDDVMANGGVVNYKISMPRADGLGFYHEDLFAGTLGLNSEVYSNRELIFNNLYNNNEFKMLTMRLDSMRRPVKYWNATRTGLDWYYIPTISMVGLDALPSGLSARGVKDVNGNYVSEILAKEIFSAYHLDSHIKVSGDKEYYNTPVNLGVTYLNEELLSTLFINNLDLMMRIKYNENLNSDEGGNGVLKGTTYSDKVRGDLSNYNPINNGSFSILRGQTNSSSPSVKSFKGVKPLIVYKVIDMYDSSNDDLLVYLFGANKGSFSSKAEYLKNLDIDVINPATNQPYDKKPFVVAKVTFYVDVVIPYFTLIAREMRASLGQGDNNFIELLPTSSSGEEGTRRMAYTRYFAVTP